MRQFLFDAWHFEMLKALNDADNDRVSAIAQKSIKEVTYHRERSADTVVALGDGTEESHQRMQSALDRLWPFVGEMFDGDDIDAAVIDLTKQRPAFDTYLQDVLKAATLTAPGDPFYLRGGKTGQRHSEHLGHMLATMQFLPRAYPDAKW